MRDDWNGGGDRRAGSERSSRQDLRSDASVSRVSRQVTVEKGERQFLLSSTADPGQTVGRREMQLLIYTAARNGEVLLKVRCFGRWSSLA